MKSAETLLTLSIFLIFLFEEEKAKFNELMSVCALQSIYCRLTMLQYCIKQKNK